MKKLEKPRNRRRLTAAVFSLALLFTMSNVTLLLKKVSFQIGPINTHSHSRYQKKFEALKQILPPHGTVGYISDEFFWEKKDNNVSRNAKGHYRLTRYTLAPLIVANNIDHKLVVGNFHSPIPYNKLQEKGLVLIKEFGNGVMLFRKDPK